MASWVGRRSPAHASSSGKVLVAFGDPRTRQAVLRGKLDRLTPRTLTEPKRLAAVLDRVRREGYALGIGELEDGLVTMAAPVLVDGRAVAAVSLSGPSYRLPERDLSQLSRVLIDAASAASHRMAGRR
jgi:DNA-binding IclR family transcriptional regulator